MLALPLWRMSNPNCKFKVGWPGCVIDLGEVPWKADDTKWCWRSAVRVLI